MIEEAAPPVQPAVVNFNILEDKDEDVFESIESNHFRNSRTPSSFDIIIEFF